MKVVAGDVACRPASELLRLKSDPGLFYTLSLTSNDQLAFHDPR